MSAELVSLIAVGSSGSVMLAGIAAHEHAQAERMRAGRVRLITRYPANLEASQATAIWNGLAGLPPATEIIAETVATEGSIEHSLWVPEPARASLRAALVGAVPAMRITDAPPSQSVQVTLSLRLSVARPTFLLTDNPSGVSRSILTGLASLRQGEAVLLRWALSPQRARPRPEPENPTPRQREIARAWAARAALPGFGVDGLILVRAASRGRARELASHTQNVLRSRRGLAGGIRVACERGTRTLASLPKVRRSSGFLSVSEIVPLLGLPLGEPVPGVEVGAARELLVPRHVPRAGRRLFVGRDSDGERPVALSPTAATHHVAVIGPSGSGKTVVLAGGILSDIAAGHAGVFVDPKGDAVDTILARVRPEHAERVVVLDAGDDTRPTPGLDVLHAGDPDLAADVLVRTLKSMFPDWGIRSETFGRLGVRTLCELPGAKLSDLGRLFADDAYRRAAVASLSDDFLRDSWRSYEALSPGARVDVVQAPMARVMALLARPRVRRVLANPNPKLDIAQLIAERKFLLVSLAPGALGEAAPLIGAAVMLATWSAIEARVKLAPEDRHLVNLTIDELATVANGLPANLELLAERARGLGASLTVAMQTLARVPEPIRSSVLANAATLITFRAGATEAPTIARELPGLTPDDLMALGQFEVAARVGIGAGSAVRVLTGRTEPLPPILGLAETIRDASAVRYGTPAEPNIPEPPQAEPQDTVPLGAERRRP